MLPDFPPALQAYLEKARAFCAYQERAPQEVHDKLRRLELEEREIALIIARLQAESYLDNERFARLFARSKFRQNGWGRFRIQQALRQKGISASTAQVAMQEIDGDAYYAEIRRLAEKKWRSLGEKRDRSTKMKVLRFLASRGFEGDLSRDATDEVWQET